MVVASSVDQVAGRASDRLAFAAERMRAAGLIPAEADAPWLERAHRTGMMLYRAFLEYRPAADVARDLRLSLIRASTVRQGDLGNSEISLASEPAMGWTRFVDGDIPVQTIDGDHVSILAGEAVAAVATAIDRLLGAPAALSDPDDSVNGPRERGQQLEILRLA
jgi:thioesterase domain-containing protein